MFPVVAVIIKFQMCIMVCSIYEEHHAVLQYAIAPTEYATTEYVVLDCATVSLDGEETNVTRVRMIHCHTVNVVILARRKFRDNFGKFFHVWIIFTIYTFPLNQFFIPSMGFILARENFHEGGNIAKHAKIIPTWKFPRLH